MLFARNLYLDGAVAGSSLRRASSADSLDEPYKSNEKERGLKRENKKREKEKRPVILHYAMT